jgi:hypothetical protein
MDAATRELEIAAAIAGRGDHAEALRRLEAMAAAGNRSVALNGLRARVAMTLWWKPDTGTFSAADCLRITEEATPGLTAAALWQHLLRWARSITPADPDAFLPDFFNLRYSTNKTEGKDTGDLARLGLAQAEEFLFGLIRDDALWENADTFHALNLIYMCSGRQNLAHYARRRVWELHESGRYSRVPGAREVPDIRPMTVLRQPRGGVLTSVKVVSDEARTLIDTQYESRRAYALAWLEARRSHAASRAAQGFSPLREDFWTGFVAPEAAIPPLAAAPAAAEAAASEPVRHDEAEAEHSNAKTWLTLAVLAGALLLGAALNSRVREAAAEGAE